jgi:hypothetical protein
MIDFTNNAKQAKQLTTIVDANCTLPISNRLGKVRLSFAKLRGPVRMGYLCYPNDDSSNPSRCITLKRYMDVDFMIYTGQDTAKSGFYFRPYNG